MELDIDKWEGNLNKGETIQLFQNSIDIVVEKLNDLNQKERTQLILSTEDSYLLIGGGGGQYVCTFTKREDEEYFNAVNTNAENSGEEIAVVTGGQEGLFSKHMVLDYASTLSAAKYYFDYAEMNPNLTWEQD